MMTVFGAKKATPAEPDESIVLAGLDDDHLKRLALQGQRGPAAELAKRSTCATPWAFLENVLTADERGHLSGGQFNVLVDSFDEHWAAVHRATLEIPAVQGNLNAGWAA